jgi:uncharacterized protein YjaZ
MKSKQYAIHNFLTLDPTNIKRDFIKDLQYKIDQSGVKNGGFVSKKYLTEKLKSFVEVAKEPMFNPERSGEIKELVDTFITKSINKLLNPSTVHIYLIPTVSEFLREYMNGIVGWCPSKNAIHLFIHPETQDKDIVETLVHEYNHTVFRNNHYWNSVEEGIVAEGLAEHFREQLVGGKRAKWTTVFNKREAFQWLKTLEPILQSENSQDYTNVFTNFDEDPYPLWSGYSIGYHVIDDYMKKNSLSWEELMMKPPKEIIQAY